MGGPSNFEAQMERKMGVDAPVRDGARPGDEADTAEEREFDALAEAIRGAGIGAGDAVKATRAALVFFSKKDREVCAGLEGKACGWAAHEEASDRLMQALGRAAMARDAALSLGCLLMAFDRAPHGAVSMRSLAAQRGVSPEKVSLEVDAFQEILGLPRMKLQKSAAAVAAYRRTNGAQWRPGRN